jgi:hypothetical protein
LFSAKSEPAMGDQRGGWRFCVDRPFLIQDRSRMGGETGAAARKFSA